MAEPIVPQLADIHNHLLPGVDDGARTLEESILHLTRMRAQGVARLAFSPHLNGSLAREAGALDTRIAELEAAFRRVVGASRGRTDIPELSFGQEILVPDARSARLTLSDPRVGLRGTRYALIEFGFDLAGDPAEVVEAVIAAGRTPIVAHPERYRRAGMPLPVDEIQRWKAAGAIVQVNGGSLLGEYSVRVTELAWLLLSRGLADLVASDHHAGFRPTDLSAVYRRIAGLPASDIARRLLSENPLRILRDEPPLPVPAVPLSSLA